MKFFIKTDNGVFYIRGKMERLDKVIGAQTEYSRKDIKKLISQKRVKVNGEIVLKSDVKVDVNQDIISIDGTQINIKEHIYLVLNKPMGYISATEDRSQATVLDLIDEKYLHRELFPAGRLDKDTTGLMIITDDGKFSHDILSPSKHVAKTYEVTIDIPVTKKMVEVFKDGIDLNDGKCKTAIMEITGENSAKVTLTEGRYHQIKRMFGCFGAKVIKLHRIKMGDFYLPEDLKEGESRELTLEELEKIKSRGEIYE